MKNPLRTTVNFFNKVKHYPVDAARTMLGANSSNSSKTRKKVTQTFNANMEQALTHANHELRKLQDETVEAHKQRLVTAMAVIEQELQANNEFEPEDQTEKMAFVDFYEDLFLAMAECEYGGCDELATLFNKYHDNQNWLKKFMESSPLQQTHQSFMVHQKPEPMLFLARYYQDHVTELSEGNQSEFQVVSSALREYLQSPASENVRSDVRSAFNDVMKLGFEFPVVNRDMNPDTVEEAPSLMCGV